MRRYCTYDRWPQVMLTPERESPAPIKMEGSQNGAISLYEW